MLKIFKRGTQQEESDMPEKTDKLSLFQRFRQGLSRTRASFADRLSNLFLGKKQIDQDLLDELETILLTSDIGIETTDHIIETITQKVKRKELADSQALFEALQETLLSILQPVCEPLQLASQPSVVLVIGTNGSGKTTSIGKLAAHYQQQGKKVMLAAGDTFRAAAVEQLQIWGDRLDIPVIAQHTGADSASVIYDAFESAKAKGCDILIADTAGRLHTQNNLMNELQKVVRVIKKIDENAPHEVMLVLDSTFGQNALTQTKMFLDALQVTGITLTKLDGTAKGGVIFSVAHQLGLPIRFVGVGEQVEDLREFDASVFVDALLKQETDD
jgi:fused signal recognition particle receptor